MGADIIQFRGRARCAYEHCAKPMVRRDANNTVAFCCYAHAVEGQPQYAKATQRNMGGLNDLA